ncbi:hypothetical protein [Pseudomonas aeruginosa]|uniref:hypothetical protein n=1 Tax=Pseudomonas aeruginosa TaxID=287 RepID=UPI0022EAA30B|nr:hypothetical protein [Pseudomonas aeruginosa]
MSSPSSKAPTRKTPSATGRSRQRERGGVGEAPIHLQGPARLAWKELCAQSIKGVLTGSDRIILEVTANLLAEYRANPTEFAVGKYTHLIGNLARLGLTPSDRQKFGLEKPKEKDEFEDF